MAYCTTTDLVNLTGSARSATVLQAIIDEADRKIGAYLRANSITGVAGDDLKSASLTLSKAGLLEYGLQTGDFQASNGDFSSSLNVTAEVDRLRKEAFGILDQYITSVGTSSGVAIVHSHRMLRGY